MSADDVKIHCPKCGSDQWAYEIGYMHPYRCRSCESTVTRYTIADSYKAQLLAARKEIEKLKGNWFAVGRGSKLSGQLAAAELAKDAEIARLRRLIAWAWEHHGQNMPLVCDEEIELETIWAEESAKKREGDK